MVIGEAVNGIEGKKSYKIIIDKIMKLINEQEENVFLKAKALNSVFVKLKEFETLKEKGEFIKNFLLEIT